MMPKTQQFTKKGDAFYSDSPAPTTGVSVRTETETITYARIENLRAHCVAEDNINQSGIVTIDGYTVKDGDFVLCPGQLLPKRRWLAKVNAAGAWTPTNDKVHSGTAVAVAFGTRNAGSVWVCQEPRVESEQGVENTSWVRQELPEATSVMWRRVRRLVKAAYDKIMCYIEEIKPYEVVCHADTLPIPFNVPTVTDTTIPFTTVQYEPTDGSFSGGQFTAGRSGYYDVDVLIINEGIVAPNYRVWLKIAGSRDVYIADTIIVGSTDGFRMQGSRKVYCEEGSTIEALLYHAGALALGVNTLAHPGGYGYISIHFCGKVTAAINQ